MAYKDDILWIKRVHCVYIKEENWWEYTPPVSAIWVRKAICKNKNVFIIACQDHKWLNGDKKYYVKEGYKWLKGPQEKVG